MSSLGVMPPQEFTTPKSFQRDKPTLKALEGKDKRGDKAEIGAIGMDKATVNQLSSSGKRAKEKRIKD